MFQKQFRLQTAFLTLEVHGRGAWPKFQFWHLNNRLKFEDTTNTYLISAHNVSWQKSWFDCRHFWRQHYTFVKNLMSWKSALGPEKRLRIQKLDKIAIICNENVSFLTHFSLISMFTTVLLQQTHIIYQSNRLFSKVKKSLRIIQKLSCTEKI